MWQKCTFEVEEDCEASMQQGDMFFGAPISTIKLAMSKEARKMGFDSMEPMSWMQVLNAGNKSRLQGYLNLESKKLEAECGVKERERWPPRVFDLSQNPTVTPRSGPRLCTLLRHSLLWSMKLERPLLGDEHLMAQGVPVYGDLTQNVFCCPYSQSLATMSEATKRSLAGNAVCIPVSGSIICFMLAATKRRESLKIGRSITLFDLSTFEEDNDDPSAESPVAKRKRTVETTSS